MRDEFPLVGRASEVRWLEERIADLFEDKGGLVLVGGEAGVGKTRLVSNVLRTVNGQAIHVTCRCPGLNETPPYGPWREAVHQLQFYGDFDTNNLPMPLGHAPASLDAYELSLGFLRWVQNNDKRIIITIEDLQWSDSASLQMLRHFSGRLQNVPLLIIGIYRSEELQMSPTLKQTLPEMLRTGSGRIMLNALHLAEVESLVRLVMPNLVNLSKVAEEVYRLTSGMPLFVTEVLGLMRQRESTTLTSLPVTDTVQEAIYAKLSYLTPETMRVLETAAFIGEQFSYTLLKDAYNGLGEIVTLALEHALKLGVVFPVSNVEDKFQFQHAIVRSVVANRIVGIRKYDLHRRIAEVLETMASHELDAIAFHYNQARDERAIPFLVAAGDRALHIGALRDAELKYREAVGAMTESDSRLSKVLLNLGLTLRWHHSDEAVRYWQQSLEIAQEQGDEVLAAWLRHLKLEHTFRQGDMTLSEGIEELAVLQETLLNDDRYQQLERELYGYVCGYPQIRIVQCKYLYSQGKLEEAQALLAKLQADSPGMNPQLLQMQMVLAAYSGQIQVATELLRQLSANKYAKHEYWAASEHYISYFYHRLLYEAEAPDELEKDAQQLVEMEANIAEKGAYGYLPREYSGVGFFKYVRGEWKAAENHLVDYVLTDPQPMPIITWFTVVMLVETRSVAKLPAVLAKLAPHQPSDPPPATVILSTWVHAVRAQYHMLQGNMSLAKEWLDAAENHPLGKGSKIHRPFIDITRADYYRRTGDLEAALQICRQALETAESIPIQWFIIKARRLLGELTAEIGRREDAVRHILSALELANQCLFPYEAALCELAAGQVIASSINDKGIRETSVKSDLEQAVQLLQTAKDTFARLGANQVNEADIVLASLLESHSTLLESRDARTGDGTASKEWSAEAAFDGVLTRRELEVAMLAAEGLTDKQIAASLYVSTKTIDHHLRNIFRKLDISNRAALASLITRGRKSH